MELCNYPPTPLLLGTTVPPAEGGLPGRGSSGPSGSQTWPGRAHQHCRLADPGSLHPSPHFMCTPDMHATPPHIPPTHLDGLVSWVSNGEGALDRLTDGGQARPQAMVVELS